MSHKTRINFWDSIKLYNNNRIEHLKYDDLSLQNNFFIYDFLIYILSKNLMLIILITFLMQLSKISVLNKTIFLKS